MRYEARLRAPAYTTAKLDSDGQYRGRREQHPDEYGVWDTHRNSWDYDDLSTPNKAQAEARAEWLNEVSKTFGAAP